ncbi:hypothetical protein [Streptomyces sp. NPDC048277]|uniref:hypothetical protein n=1 Tax=Streptomyces sp. NPDC048277 TaxID=3155027 RepID=UPI0033F6D1B6
MYFDPRDDRRVVRVVAVLPDGHGPATPPPPAWRLAGEDDEIDRDHPHICRGVD